MSSYYSRGSYYTCSKCNRPQQDCRCRTEVVRSPGVFIKEIREDMNHNKFTAIDESNNINVWYSAIIKNLTEVGDDLVIHMVSGESYTVPLYKGLSLEQINVMLTGFVTQEELNNLKLEIKGMLNNYVSHTEMEVIKDSILCQCSCSCGCGCDEPSEDIETCIK